MIEHGIARGRTEFRHSCDRPTSHRRRGQPSGRPAAQRPCRQLDHLATVDAGAERVEVARLVPTRLPHGVIEDLVGVQGDPEQLDDERLASRRASCGFSLTNCPARIAARGRRPVSQPATVSGETPMTRARRSWLQPPRTDSRASFAR
jgi:hypothetical protein